MAIDQTTIDALRRCRAAYGSTLRMVRALGLPQGTTYDILAARHAHVSRATENAVRACLGLAALPAAQLQLAPNQRLVTLKPAEQRDRRRCLHCSAPLHDRLKRQRGPLSEEAFLTKLADLWDKDQAAVIQEVPSI